MQKRSHKLLAATLLENTQGFQARRFELAFLFGSFQPDCNPLTYLKGSLRAYKFRGHNYSNSQHYIYSRISRLQRRQRWTIWQYYTLGKLTHYLADAFTYPHNENYPDSMLCHHQYETDLRAYLEEYLATRALRREKFRQDVADALQELHRQYMAGVADMRKDVQFILKATSLLRLSEPCFGKSAQQWSPFRRILWNHCQFPFAFSGVILKLSKDSERNPVMTNITRSAEYRYFSFTYFYGKAYFGLAENVCDRI